MNNLNRIKTKNNITIKLKKKLKEIEIELKKDPKNKILQNKVKSLKDNIKNFYTKLLIKKT